MENLGALNWSIVILYLVVNLVMGSMLSKKIHTAEDYYVGQKTTPWWAIGLSVMATYVSAMSFLGGPAWSYQSGLGVMMIQINYPLVVFLVITFFLPFFYNSGVVSIYEYQERRFGKKARAVMSIIFMMTQTLSSAAVLYATALVLSYMTGFDVVHAIIAISLIALVYTMMGGITAVIWTDVLQALILLVGAIIILFALIDRMPESLSLTLDALRDQDKLNILDWSLDTKVTATVWSGVIAMTLYHTTVYGANQMVVQRALAARNIGDAKKSFMLMGFGAFFIYFMFLMMGVLFFSYYGGREFDNSNTIVLEFAAEYGMPGLLGIVAAAVVAASMSSLDSALNSLATVTTVDFYEKYLRPGASGEHYLKASRWFTVLWAVLIVGPAIAFAGNQGSVLELLTKAGSFFVGAKLSMYALGFFSRDTTERGLLVGVAAGFVAVWAVAVWTDISWPWYCAIGAFFNVVVSLGASRLLDGRQSEYSPYTVKGQRALFVREGWPITEGGWSLLPGKVDSPAWLLIVFFFITMGCLAVLSA